MLSMAQHDHCTGVSLAGHNKRQIQEDKPLNATDAICHEGMCSRCAIPGSVCRNECPSFKHQLSKKAFPGVGSTENRQQTQ